MDYRKVGTSGLNVSAISLGAGLTFGSSRVDENHAIACIHHAIERGINFIDVADMYSLGRGEEVVGQAVKDFKRSDLVISTKAYWPMSEDVNDRGLSRKHITESVNKSLKRFGMEYVDIFFCHRPDPEVPVEETIRAIEALINQGKILYWGTSMWTAKDIDGAYDALKTLNMNPPIVEQPLYNMLDRHGVEGSLEDSVGRHGMGLVAFSPLAQGVLTGKYNDHIPQDSRASADHWDADKGELAPARIAKARAITALAHDLGVTPSALAIAWVLKNPHVASAITGATHRTHIDDNLKALDVKITDEINTKIEAILQNKPVQA